MITKERKGYFTDGVTPRGAVSHSLQLHPGLSLPAHPRLPGAACPPSPTLWAASLPSALHTATRSVFHATVLPLLRLHVCAKMHRHCHCVTVTSVLCAVSGCAGLQPRSSRPCAPRGPGEREARPPGFVSVSLNVCTMTKLLTTHSPEHG